MKSETLKTLVKDWNFQARQMRIEAEKLIEKAALLEVKAVDLDIAISKAEQESEPDDAGAKRPGPPVPSRPLGHGMSA